MLLEGSACIGCKDSAVTDAVENVKKLGLLGAEKE